MKKFTCFIILICFFLADCKKPVQYSEIPEIKFISFEHLSSKDGLLSYYFQDGDGDLGLDETDDKPPFNMDSIYFYNFFCDYYEKQNGVFVKIDSVEVNGVLEPFSLNARFPRLSVLENESINGEIYHKMEPYRIAESPNDTVKLVFFIVDRALHHSNVDSVVVIRRLDDKMMR
jgi:hypothetical protein